MRKLLPALGVVALVLCASMAQAGWAPLVWNFDDGLQGWTLGGNAAAKWVDPAVEPNGPNLPDGAPSGGGAGNLYLPDKGYAELDVSAYNLGNGAGRLGFALTAKVYIPNLSPLTGFNYGYPGNMAHNAGIAAVRSDGKGMFITGEISNGRMRAKDWTWDNTSRGPKWTIEGMPGQEATWWDKWVTVSFDYNFSVKGKWNAAVYIPWSGPVHTAGWQTLAENITCNGDIQFVKLRLGSFGGDSWTQAQFDEVHLCVVPEPGSMLALATGLVGFAGLVRRKA